MEPIFTTTNRWISLFLLTLAFLPANLSAQTHSWEWGAWGGGQSIEAATQVIMDASGASYATGFFASDTFYTGGLALINPVQGGSFNSTEQMFLAKYDASGNAEWAVWAGGSRSDRGLGLDLDGQGNVYVCGYFRDSAQFGGNWYIGGNGYNFFLAKYDPAGNFLWVRHDESNPESQARTVAVDNAGNAYVGGHFVNDIAIGGMTIPALDGNRNGFIAKFETNGDFLWMERIPALILHTTNSSGLAALDLTDDGEHLAVVGTYRGTTKFGPNQQIQLTSYGPFLDGHFLAYYDTTGVPQWAKAMNELTLGTSSGPLMADMEINSNNDIFFTGTIGQVIDFDGTSYHPDTSQGQHTEIFLAKFSSAGNLDFVNLWGGSDMDEGHALAIDDQDNVYLSGVWEEVMTMGNTTFPFGNPFFCSWPAPTPWAMWIGLLATNWP